MAVRSFTASTITVVAAKRLKYVPCVQEIMTLENVTQMKRCTNVNCVKAGKDEVSHAAFSFECPSYIAEQDKLKKSINYYSKNP